MIKFANPKPKKQLNIRLDNELREILEDIAKKEGVTITTIIQTVIEDWLKREKKK